MKSFPHTYPVDASSDPDGPVAVSSKGLPSLVTAPPAQFEGPGDQWSPETLLVAAVADCFVLTFRAIARASKFEWSHLDCHAEGTLDRVDRTVRFTHVTTVARLRVAPGADAERARALLEKAEANCLISNSLSAESKLVAEVIVGE